MPQLIFSKLGIAEEYNVRVALYVLATGVTDPEKICADLKLRSRISAESALSFWPVRGFSSATTKTPRREQSLCSCPMTWAEIAPQAAPTHDLEPHRLRSDRLCPPA